MNSQEYLDEDVVYRHDRVAKSDSTNSLSRRILVAYPGERIAFSTVVKRPVGHTVQIKTEGPPGYIASVTVNPDMSTAPFTSTITVSVKRGAAPGNYPFNLMIYDIIEDRFLGLEHMVLVVLDERVPKAFARHYNKLIKLYTRYGAQAAIWYLLSYVFTRGATFNQLKAAYELVTRRQVSNGTIGNILKRMKKKRIIIEKHPGVYVSNIKDFNVLLSRIDLARVRMQANRVRKSRYEPPKIHTENVRIDFSKLPKTIRRVWEKAQEISYEHGALAALYFLIYTLLGARQTGYLLYWFNTWFIYCEQKTNFCHHFYSLLLHEMLRRLGLKEGVMYSHNQRHEEAKRIAQQYIREYYGSHPNARRLHYQLKELRYLRYDDDVYTLKIYHYQDGSIGIEIYDDKGEELLHCDGAREDKTVVNVEVKSAFPFEHIDEENEETYFSRPSGLY